ncbi:MAG TPA: type III-B CRISPR-associated protein Cas10/Cmr2, partial [Pirellulales bacterium]|nr:type III-B CRISPR-associated protein Cas10/Cmr2 [Pirellulales bacterium]
MGVSWRDLILAWLHDPPDKALSIADHVTRARRYATAATGVEVSESDLSQHGDVLASATERFPMPKGDADSRRVGPADRIRLCHPLSAVDRPVSDDLRIDERLVENTIHKIVGPLRGAEADSSAFLALWRRLRDRLASQSHELAWLPADTRSPDHTVWQHMDITAALAASDWGENTAFLSFGLGPVQSFIATARSVRDLWSGSMILSWLTFEAMWPVVEKLGPTALVYPALRGVPLYDLAIKDRIRAEARELNLLPQQLKSPCLPNRFVAVVPWGENGEAARGLASACESACKDAWRGLCDKVHQALTRELSLLADAQSGGWDRHWHNQVDDFFDFRTVVLPWKDCDDDALARWLRGESAFKAAFPEAAKLRRLASAIPAGEAPGGRQDAIGQWQHRLEMAARLMEANKSIRHIGRSTEVGEGEKVPGKCALFGTYEQMGPAGLNESADFWDQAAKLRIGPARLRRRERLCAVALVKRFAGPAFFNERLKLHDHDLAWPDTATIAAATWLKEARSYGIDLGPDRVKN